MKKLANRHAEALKPFADLFYALKGVVDGLSDRQLEALVKACGKVTPQNCSWATFEAAVAVIPHAKHRAQFRQKSKGKNKSARPATSQRERRTPAVAGSE